MNQVYVVETEGLTTWDYAEHLYSEIEIFWKVEDANEYAKMRIESAQKENEHVEVSVYSKKIQ